jgi:ADP-ribosylglycohydrolase
MENLNIKEFRDKVYGCWTGKNIGGTLGAPFEGIQEMNNIDFYTQELGGEPLPNDDLDLQLVWLQALEENGVYQITPRLLGEYWMNHISASWNEYGVCKANVANGLYPPLSGSCNNETWKDSNGAWIRSELWACLFPGDPSEAMNCAWMDACADHYGEGIYAEIFTAVLESAAFIVSDLRELIRIGLSKVPPDSKVAQSIKLACAQYDKGANFRKAREAVVKANEANGWFQSPMNLGFLVIALLYGEGDFGKTCCLAVNCGDDTDCTAATAGAILGIIFGRSGIPARWIEPIGETITTCAITTFGMETPKNLSELTDRVIRLAKQARCLNPTLLPLGSGKTQICRKRLEKLENGSAKLIWSQSPYELIFDLPYGRLSVDYENGPIASSGVPKRLVFKMKRFYINEGQLTCTWSVPEGWKAAPEVGGIIMAKKEWSRSGKLILEIVPGSFPGPYVYLPIKLSLAGRTNPLTIYLPFQQEGSVNYENIKLHCGDPDVRHLARKGLPSSHVVISDLCF